MPESNEFRVGDRVETRRGSDVPENFRQRRAEVTRVRSDGRVRLLFANPPVVPWDQHPHGDLWYPYQLRLVERTLRLEVGGKVLVSNPAYMNNAEMEAQNSTVPDSYYGQTCTVVASHSVSIWQVRREDGRQCYVGADWLTVIEEAPPPKFVDGDSVITQSPCYTTAGAEAWERHDETYSDRVGVVTSRASNGRWYVSFDDGDQINVHENWLDPFVDDTEPIFKAGDVVHVGSAPHGYVGNRSPVSSLLADVDALVMEANGARYKVRSHRGNTAWVHQEHLTAVEFTYPEEGAFVRTRPFGMQCRDPEVGFTRPLTSSVLNKYGQVTISRTTKGNTKLVLENGTEVAVHPFYLQVLTAAENEARIRPHQRLRVDVDAFQEESQTNRVHLTLLGRVVSAMNEDAGGGRWQVNCAETTESGYVHVSGLTRLVPTVGTEDVICEQCHEGVAEADAREYGESLYCPRCVVDCEGCDNEFFVNAYGYEVRVIDGDWQCLTCVPNCARCATPHPTGEMDVEPGTYNYYCTNCQRPCAARGCNETAYGQQSYCAGCRSHIGESALGRWRSTPATMWLGGPVRKKGGYYIANELEISASGDYSLRALREWSRLNFGSADALDLKPDGSVAGFEIAFQPMTPAYFEAVDWVSFFDVLDTSFPIHRGEPDGHGLHVHIGRQAFRRAKMVTSSHGGKREVMATDHAMIAAFTYLLTRGATHVQRIGRRPANHYCSNISNPVKAALQNAGDLDSRQKDKILNDGTGRVPNHTAAVNLTNPNTIEIRAFRSTRDPQEFIDAHRLIYLAAEYVRHLRSQGTINPKALTWGRFSLWVAKVMPEAYPSISGLAGDIEPSTPEEMTDLMAAFRTSASEAASSLSRPNTINEEPEAGGDQPFQYDVDELDADSASF